MKKISRRAFGKLITGLGTSVLVGGTELRFISSARAAVPTPAIDGTAVCDQASTCTAPFAAIPTPSSRSPSPAVCGLRPVANSTWSAGCVSPLSSVTRSSASGTPSAVAIESQ